ncbi:MAG: hypothetical protein GC192_12085 [Bacteroidetes bacterium]|nr:hypothetical protein [Bacteroidota bacterium]
MKKLIFFAGLLLVFTACNNEKNETTDTDDDDAGIVEETQVEENPNQTDLDFNVALDAFRKKDFATAAKYIETAITDLKTEDTTTDAKGKAQLAATVENLNELAAKVNSGQVKDEAELRELYAQVDMMTSHHFFVLTEEYAVNAPERSEGTLKKAGERLERAEKKLDGEAKDECRSLSADLKSFQNRADKETLKIGDVAGAQAGKVFNWIKKHAEKMGIKPPKEAVY